MIPYGLHQIDESDIQEVVDALRSEFLTTGPIVDDFESRFAGLVGAKHAIAVSNGTAALHLAMRVAQIGTGDRVVTSPNTFLASANCAAYVDAIPDFSDIDTVTYTLCPDRLAATWRPDTKAVVAVDYAGQTADMPAIADVARAGGAIVVEDACHAVGGKFHHGGEIHRVGGHPWADMTTFSFHPVKTMTTGEGGMLVTDNDAYAQRARQLRNHGMTRDPSQFIGLSADGFPDGSLEKTGPWYYEMNELGYNYRITDIQCALGRSQLRRLPEFIARRQAIVDNYNEQFAALPFVRTPELRQPDDAKVTSWHLYTLQIDFTSLNTSRTEFMDGLLRQGVRSQVLYIPVHLQPWYRERFGYEKGKCPNAEAYYEQTLSLPLHAGMSDQDVRQVIDAVRSLVTVAC